MRENDFLNNKINFCVVEDDPSFRDLFSSMLEEYGNVEQIGAYRHAIQYLKRNRPDILFVDMDLNGVKDGPKIVDFASKKDIHVVVVSSYGDDETISECINLGAKDYYQKGEEVSLVKDIISKYKKAYKKPSNKDFNYTLNKQFRLKLDFVLNNAKTEFPILLEGPTGSGKTFLAKQLHMMSGLKGKFVAINCSSISDGLFESEMFGHKKGSFSGAEQDYDGKILEADGGTLYLDEIDSMPLDQQGKLLKVIEEKEFYPVGSNEVQKSNFRLISSSQRNFNELITEGKFRRDLYHRIELVNLNIPPLRERKEDILPLLKMMLKGPRKYQFTQDFNEIIENYDWPGNIRELSKFANHLELSRESKITEELGRSLINNQRNKKFSLTSYQKALFDEHGLEDFINMIRSEAIKYCEEKNNGDVSTTIKELGCSSASYYRWKDHQQVKKTRKNKAVGANR